MVMICPLVISWAIPRPATIRISVATIGWMRARETSSPFHRPHSVPAARSARMMIPRGVLVASLVRISLVISLLPRAGLISTAPMAAEMAITAPTERSTPPVAITRVMPMATSASGAPSFSTSIRFPYRWPSRMPILKKLGA